MEIILKENVKGLGYKNDVVNVKPGYARNFLIPRCFAIEATSSNKKVVAELVKQQALKAQKLKQAALDLSAKLADITLIIKAKAGESGKIFGSVTTTQLAEVLRDKGFDIDRRDVSINSDVKMLGSYTAVLDLHREVKQEIKFDVVAD
jgi:large subunit ribosomal protein L9